MAEPTDVTGSRESHPTADPNASKIPDPNRRALIAGVAGLVAGALASAERPAEATHFGNLELGHTNSANGTTALFTPQLNSAALKLVSFGGPAYQVSYGPFGSSLLPSNATAGIYSIGSHGPSLIAARGEVNATALQSRVFNLDDEFGALVYTQHVNSTALIAEHAHPQGVSAEFRGRVQMPCGCFTIPSGSQQHTVTDPLVTPDSVVVVCPRIYDGNSVIVQVQPFSGFFTARLNRADNKNDMQCGYVVFDCPGCNSP